MAKRKRQKTLHGDDIKAKIIQPERAPSKLQLKKRKISRTKPAFNSQDECPFFHPERGLPREIRDIIFGMALTSYEDAPDPPYIYAPGTRFGSEQFDKLPAGNFCFRRTDVSLLQTCRAVYQETRLIPVALNVQTLWYKKYIRSQCTLRPSPTTAKDYFNNMKTEQLAAIQHLQIFLDRRRWFSKDAELRFDLSILAELGLIRGVDQKMRDLSSRALGRFSRLCPETITITFRDTHFYLPPFTLEEIFPELRWEQASGWLKTLRMEFEIPKNCPRTEEMQLFVKSLSETPIDVGNGEELFANQDIQESTWTGTLVENINKARQRWLPREILVFTAVWRVRPAGERALVGEWLNSNPRPPIDDSDPEL